MITINQGEDPTNLGFFRAIQKSILERKISTITNMAADIVNILTGMKIDLFYVDFAQVQYDNAKVLRRLPS